MSAPGNPVSNETPPASKDSLPAEAGLWWPNMEESRVIMAALDEGTEAIEGDEDPEFLPDDPDEGDED